MRSVFFSSRSWHITLHTSPGRRASRPLGHLLRRPDCSLGQLLCPAASARPARLPPSLLSPRSVGQPACACPPSWPRPSPPQPRPPLRLQVERLHHGRQQPLQPQLLPLLVAEVGAPVEPRHPDDCTKAGRQAGRQARAGSHRLAWRRCLPLDAPAWRAPSCLGLGATLLRLDGVPL